ncbi:MAG: hypothetical protein H6683_08980 [Deltaproteobacteria bacterium]|nr:hypothetical protein [Deltaproteobacteria bacterium]
MGGPVGLFGLLLGLAISLAAVGVGTGDAIDLIPVSIRLARVPVLVLAASIGAAVLFSLTGRWAPVPTRRRRSHWLLALPMVIVAAWSGRVSPTLAFGILSLGAFLVATTTPDGSLAITRSRPGLAVAGVLSIAPLSVAAYYRPTRVGLLAVVAWMVMAVAVFFLRRRRLPDTLSILAPAAGWALVSGTLLAVVFESTSFASIAAWTMVATQFFAAILLFISEDKATARALAVALCLLTVGPSAVMAARTPPWPAEQSDDPWKAVSLEGLNIAEVEIFRDTYIPRDFLPTREGGWFMPRFFRYDNSQLAQACDKYCILALGSSTTEGIDDQIGSSWPEQLERRLNRDRDPAAYRVVNAGLGGATGLEMVYALKRRLYRMHPDAVIVDFGVGDAQTEIGGFSQAEIFAFAQAYNAGRRAEDTVLTPRAEARPIADTPSTPARAVEALGAYLGEPTADEMRRETTQVWFSLRRNLRAVITIPSFVRQARELAELARTLDFDLMILVEPSREPELSSRYLQILRLIAAEEGIAYLNGDNVLSACAPDRETLFIDESHPTIEGYQCLANAVATKMHGLGWASP